MCVSDGWLWLEVTCSSVINNYQVRPGNLANYTDGALVTSVVIILVVSVTVEALLGGDDHLPRSVFPSQNMTDLVLSLRLPDHDNLRPGTAPVATLVVGRDAGDDGDDEAIQEEDPDTPHCVVVTVRLPDCHRPTSLILGNASHDRINYYLILHIGLEWKLKWNPHISCHWSLCVFN